MLLYKSMTWIRKDLIVDLFVFYPYLRHLLVQNKDTVGAAKTAITLAPPTVGRQSADLSADKMPDFSSFFIGRQKLNYNYLVIFFFPSADSFGVLAIGR